ncbi:ABC transporter ATP-binding protein [Bifidobacterium choloepi]|uniref:ATP-binding cassette domain-containing protein n=1 Tax=Bifidobacterium choloepi TaxID=2614131 RepID=A0A6I5NAD5_9BIFI|nr:ATP-binding cassette domain-containing protein [Bifidobacterium choloepi]NEG69460.1 ATP-binding cassette domain-containing protein [Bifidobacterium choloepi]
MESNARRHDVNGNRPVVEARGLVKSFGRGRKAVEVLHGVDVTVREGQCVAIIGESGSGKTTTSRILFGMDVPDAGTVTWHAADGGAAGDGTIPATGVVYQNPFDSLDPRWTAAQSIAEPLRLREPGLSPVDVERRVAEALEIVALSPAEFAGRYACDMSGGQAQRVAIARALVVRPSVLLADEPMSAIDVAARVQILEALQAARAVNPAMAIVVVSHDLGVVQHLADWIVVMHDGHVVESGPTADILGHPGADYTRELIAAARL